MIGGCPALPDKCIKKCSRRPMPALLPLNPFFPMNRISRALGGPALALLLASPLTAQQVVDLTLESAVEMAMDDSYQVRRVRLDILRTRKDLEAERAGLKS